mmetsp:Transcript_574/g.519  ORF Transcript_574/g.519 Transcript_574/m.519 type:complete len:90 (-) Transcript_574:1097-1366(-)
MQFLPFNPHKLTNPKLSDEFYKRLEDFKMAQNVEDETSKLFGDYDPEMVFLGTNSLRPWHFRNVSGIFFRFWQQAEKGILLDCGTGTYF